jgi:shikimate dehydrogenase
MKMISVKTKLVGLLGNPLTFTFSPQMHNTTFDAYGLDYFYIPFEVGNQELGDVIKAIRHLNFAGFNVTKPNKVKIIPYLDEVNELAAKIGAVNTVVKKGDKLIGYNTDGEGYVSSLKDETGLDPKGKKFTILGAGGAGRAVAFTLAFYGAAEVEIYDNAEEVGRQVVDEINEKVSACAKYTVFTESNIAHSINTHDVIINATGVGMIPNTDRTPIDKKLLKKDIIVSDVTYNPQKTRLLIEAEEVGCKVHNGVGMLIHQGAKAFSLWTEIEPPVESMTHTVKEIITNLNK